jgi:hypothetical protein
VKAVAGRAFPGLGGERLLAFAMAGALVLATGCLRIKSEPVEVKPIHITLDINVKVDRELDSFFEDIDAKAKEIKPADVAGSAK